MSDNGSAINLNTREIFWLNVKRYLALKDISNRTLAKRIDSNESVNEELIERLRKEKKKNEMLAKRLELEEEKKKRLLLSHSRKR